MNTKDSIFSQKLLNFEVFNYIFNGVFIIDKEQNIVFWNKIMADWTSLNSKSVCGKKLSLLFPSFKKFIYQQQIDTVLNYHTTAIFSSHLHRDIYITNDGKNVNKFLHTTVNYLPPDKSTKPYIIFSIEDQTQLTELILSSKKSQKQLLIKEEQLQKVNQNLEMRIEERTVDLQKINTELKKEIEERSKYARQLKESREKLSTNNKELSGLNVELKLINERLNQANIELERAKLKAEESDRLKSAFLANVSHEIRTPMNSILGFSELLQEEFLTEELRKTYLNLILKSGHQLLALIDDILDISKIESGQIVIQKQNIAIDQLLDEIKETFQPDIDKKSLKLITKYQLIDNYIVEIDYTRTKQILNNFVSNAIKFTENGFIEILAKEQDNQLYFHVRDSGIGIEEKSHNKIFERFHQAKKTTGKLYGGTGLGLAISRNLIELMGGKIVLKSTPGEGSTFAIFLPLK